MKEKTPLLHRIVCFQMPEKGFMPEASLRFKFLGEKLSFSFRVLFITMFYNINSSPVLFTKNVFMVINFFEYLPKIYPPFKLIKVRGLKLSIF